MKITKIRTKLYNWKGPVKTTDTIFATPLSLLPFQEDCQAPFRFFSWLVVEIETDQGHSLFLATREILEDLGKDLLERAAKMPARADTTSDESSKAGNVD